jgi:16S rRNA processing protein RimM
LHVHESFAAPENWPDDAVEVGVIVDAYGLKGGVKIAPHAQQHSGNALLSAKHWWLMQGHERWLAACVSARMHGEVLVAQLDGIADRDAALALRGTRIHLGRSEFPPPDDDEFYWVDLIGLDVVNEAGVALGQVAGLIDNGAHSVLRVVDQAAQAEPATPASAAAGKGSKAAAGRERLIPFVDAYVKAVDQGEKRIVVDWQADY